MRDFYIIPKKISLKEITTLRIRAHKLMEEEPSLRFGQAVVVQYSHDHSHRIVFPDLFHTKDEHRAETVISEVLWNGETV